MCSKKEKAQKYHEAPSNSKISSEAHCTHQGAMNLPTNSARVSKCWGMKDAKEMLVCAIGSTTNIAAPWCGGCPFLHAYVLVLLCWHRAHVMLLIANIFILLSLESLDVIHMVISFW